MIDMRPAEKRAKYYFSSRQWASLLPEERFIAAFLLFHALSDEFNWYPEETQWQQTKTTSDAG